jgi:hypothetical protein
VVEGVGVFKENILPFFAGAEAAQDKLVEGLGLLVLLFLKIDLCFFVQHLGVAAGADFLKLAFAGAAREQEGACKYYIPGAAPRCADALLGNQDATFCPSVFHKLAKVLVSKFFRKSILWTLKKRLWLVVWRCVSLKNKITKPFLFL